MLLEKFSNKLFICVSLCWFDSAKWPGAQTRIFVFWGGGDGGLVKRKETTKHGTRFQVTIFPHITTRLKWERLDWALCGLDQTGRTLSTYRGSRDRTHSVFLVLFWLGMDLEKQKDGATDMHVWNCLVWREEPFGISFCFVKQTLPGLKVLEQKFIFQHTTVVLCVSLVQEGRKRQS